MGNMTPRCVFCGGHGNKILSPLASRKLRQVVRSSALMTLSYWIKGPNKREPSVSVPLVCAGEAWVRRCKECGRRWCGSESYNIKRQALVMFGQTFLLFLASWQWNDCIFSINLLVLGGKKCIQLIVPPGQQGRSASLWNDWGWIKLNRTGGFNSWGLLQLLFF